jgi:hypothetical protein
MVHAADAAKPADFLPNAMAAGPNATADEARNADFRAGAGAEYAIYGAEEGLKRDKTGKITRYAAWGGEWG